MRQTSITQYISKKSNPVLNGPPKQTEKPAISALDLKTFPIIHKDEKRMAQLETVYRKMLGKQMQLKKTIMKIIPKEIPSVPIARLWIHMLPHILLQLQILYKSVECTKMLGITPMMINTAQGYQPRFQLCQCRSSGCPLCVLKWISQRFGLKIADFWVLIRGQLQPNGLYLPPADWIEANHHQYNAIVYQFQKAASQIQYLEQELEKSAYNYFVNTGTKFNIRHVPIYNLDLLTYHVPYHLLGLQDYQFESGVREIESLIFNGPIEGYFFEKRVQMEQMSQDVYEGKTFTWIPEDQEIDRSMFKVIKEKILTSSVYQRLCSIVAEFPEDALPIQDEFPEDFDPEAFVESSSMNDSL